VSDTTTKPVPSKIYNPSILTIDIAGEDIVLALNNSNDAFDVYEILVNNGYHVTLSPVTTK